MLHHIFEQTRKKFSNFAAICENNQRFTYAEVQDLVDRMSVRLFNIFSKQTHFIGKNILILQERSLSQMVTLISLSKLGMTPILIDPSIPIDRLQHIFDETHPIGTITDRDPAWYANKPGLNQIPFWVANDLLQPCNDSAIQHEMINNTYKIVEAQKDVLTAYIVYSSGTTGFPKGIPIKHPGLHYWNHVIKNSLCITPEERVLGFCSPGFDAHIWEYIMAWGAGACLVIFKKMAQLDLAEFIQIQHINHATLLPTVLRDINIKENIIKFKDSGLKSICSTGEACSEDLVHLFDTYNINLWNCYGPSELTFGLSILKVDRSMLVNGNVPIGLPKGKEIEIFIDNNGELCVSSPYQTSGYINNKRETENNFFILNKKIFYRTKDIVSRCLSNQNVLIYHGRVGIDTQVKINGVLVNPSETERLMRKHHNIQDAFVFPAKIKDTQILASCYTTKSLVMQPIFWYDYLKNSLVAQAIPILNMHVPHFPMSTHGKLDKKSLVEQFNKQIPTLLDYKINHLDDIEQKIQAIFCDIFIVPPRNKTQNILSLGGNSILFAKLISAIENEFNLINIIPVVEYLPMETLSIERCAKLIAYYYLREGTQISLTYLSGNKGSDNMLLFLPPVTGESNYNEMANYLDKSDLDFCCFSINLRMNTTKYLKSAIKQNNGLDYLSPKIFTSLMKLGKTKHVYLAGWSSGGNLAWNVAYEFEKNGINVYYLGLYDSICPDIYLNTKSNIFALELLHLIATIHKKYHWFRFDLNQTQYFKDTIIIGKEILSEIIHAFFEKNLDNLVENKAIKQKYFLTYSILLITVAGKTPILEKNSPYIYYYQDTLSHLKNTFPAAPFNGQLFSLGWIKNAPHCYITAHNIGNNHFDFEVSQTEAAKRLYADLSHILANRKNKVNIPSFLEFEQMKMDIKKLQHAFFEKKNAAEATSQNQVNSIGVQSKL